MYQFKLILLESFIGNYPEKAIKYDEFTSFSSFRNEHSNRQDVFYSLLQIHTLRARPRVASTEKALF